jgi:hypothetical protein
MLTFWQYQSPETYSDLMVTRKQGRQESIYGISLLGSEMAVKVYRAKFADNNMAKKEAQFLYQTEYAKRSESITKPATKFTVLPSIKTEQGMQTIMLSEDLFWALSEEELFLKLYQYLNNNLNIPCPSPEEECFHNCMTELLATALKSYYFLPCTAYGNYGDAVFYLVSPTMKASFQEDAEKIISKYLLEDSTPEELMEGIDGVADYIEKFATDIGEKIGSRVTYLHTPGDYDNAFFEKFDRKLFPQQKDVAVAASKRLEIADNVIISGQMGVGKTTIGVAACHHHAAGKNYRTFVSCPGHLVHKWAREVQTVIPNAKTFIFTGDDQKPWQEFYNKWRFAGELDSPEYWIVSNEAMRSGYILRPGIRVKRQKVWDAELECWTNENVAICPRCGEVLDYPKKNEGEQPILVMLTESDFENHTTKNHKCRHCNEMLWQADNNRKGFRKISIANIVQKKMPKRFFQYFIADEVHKYKGSTAQGLAFGGIISKVSKTIAMTGTLADGYANGLYYLLWRMSPNQFKAKDFLHDEESRSRFQHEYGFWVKTIKIKEDSYGKSSKARNARVQVKPLPGYTINTFPEWLIERTVFLKLSDVAPFLPPKTEFVNAVEMDDDLAENYNEIEAKLRSEIKEGGSQVASIMLHTCLSYPDVAEGPEIIQIVKPDYQLYYPVPQLDRDKLYNKERELQTIVQAELALGRKCLVFSTYSNLRDCLPRIKGIVSQVKGANVEIMRSNTVSTVNREKWVKDKLKNQGTNVIICHPELVETGLDLLECQTIIWMQTGYVPATVRQASSRSWRIGQTEPVKVIFLCYKDTLQEKCFQLIGSKLNAAGILEGNLSNEGLRNFGATQNMFNDILSLLKDNITVTNSNDIFESYKAEVAELLSKSNLTQQEQVRLMTLSEMLVSNNISLDSTGWTKGKKAKFLAVSENQLCLF